MRGITGLCASTLLLAGVAPVAWSHHSFAAIFDAGREMQVTGTLSKVDWINPHSYFYVDVKGEKGDTVTWAFESFPPQMLGRMGFKRDVLFSRVGKTVTVFYSPALKKDEHLGYGRVLDFKGDIRVEFTPPDKNGN